MNSAEDQEPKPTSRNYYITTTQNTIEITESQNGRGWKGPLWVI